MTPKHSLDDAMGSSSTAKRARSTTTPIVKRNYRANFDSLCALHNWTPSEIVRDKLATLLQLSGNRLEASELLPLAFVQHYPFIWVKDFLLLGYNHEDESVWYKAFPSGRGMARGRYYNSSQVNILGKHTVKKFWQPWVDVFDIEQRGLDRTHEYFTGVYLILKKFPNLRYKSEKGKGDARDPQNVIRATGVAEYPFNDDHPFMQETSSELNDFENHKTEAVLRAETDNGQNQNNVSIKQEGTGLHDDEDRAYLLPRKLSKQFTFRADSRPPVEKNGLGSPILYSSMPFDSRAHSRDSEIGYRSQDDTNMTALPHDLSKQPIFRATSRVPGSPSMSQFDKHRLATSQPTRTTLKNEVGPRIEDDMTAPIFQQTSETSKSHENSLELASCDSTLSKPSQKFRELTIRVPIEEPRWSNTNFEFAVVTSMSTVPAPVIRSIEE